MYGDLCIKGFSELKRTFTVPMEINYVRSKQVNYPCINAFSRDHMFSYSSVDADATHSKE